jgi:hypothetical protein
MASASSQPFGNLLPNWSSAFKTPLDPMQTLPVKPEIAPGLAGSYMDSPEMQLMKEEKDPFVKIMLLKRMDAREDMANLPNILKTIRSQDYEDRLKSRRLQAEELMFRGFMDAVKGAPAKLTAHRDMVAPMNSLLRQTRRSPINYGAVPIQRLF